MVEEVQKQKTGPAPEITFSGTPGGRFHIYGQGLGASGSVLIGGFQMETLGRSTTEIHGRWPKGTPVPTGEVEVVVHVDDVNTKTTTVRF